MFVVALVALAGLGVAALHASDGGWDRHPAPWREDKLLSRCVHRPEGNYVVWLYNSFDSETGSDMSMFVVPLPEGRRCA